MDSPFRPDHCLFWKSVIPRFSSGSKFSVFLSFILRPNLDLTVGLFIGVSNTNIAWAEKKNQVELSSQLPVGDFPENFKAGIDNHSHLDDISSDKSGVMNGTAGTSEDSSRRDPLDEQYSMARLVRELRELTGLTQEKFAAKFGVTFPTINRWKNDRAKPSPLAMEKMESLLRSLGDKGKALHKRNEVVDPILDQVDLLESQNSALSKARDLLLPKLMNGEVAV
ncbi:MAG: helix-turn-helix domain-containing protein [Dissulfuribacterales bacterium]